MTVLDFSSLQHLFDAFPDGPIPSRAEDGVFDRLGQILAASRAAGRLVCQTDLMALVRHVLRRQSLHTSQPALLAVPSRSGLAALARDGSSLGCALRAAARGAG